MAKVGVFFSFEFDRDKKLYGSFFAQAKEQSRHAIRNYSLNKVHPPDDWKVEAENLLHYINPVLGGTAMNGILFRFCHPPTFAGG